MKILQLLIVSALSIPIYGQSIDAEVQALKVENLESFSDYLDDTISFYKDDEPQVISKQEVVSKLETFITSHNLSKIALQHSTSRGYNDFKYIIGKVRGLDANYRLFFHIESNGGTDQITEIRINRV